MRFAVLSGLLMLSIFSVFATANSGDVALEFEVENGVQEWYSYQDSITLNPMLVNYGDSTSVLNDPSCNVVLKVYDEAGELIYDSTQCRGQEQTIQMASSQQREFDALTWDFTNSNGEVVESGYYTIDLVHTATSLTSSHEILVLAPHENPEQVELSLALTSRDSQLSQNENFVLSIALYNPTNADIVLPENGHCSLLLEIAQSNEIVAPCFEKAPRLRAKEYRIIDTVVIDSNTFAAGENMLSVSTIDGALESTIAFQVAEEEATQLPDLEGLEVDMRLSALDLSFAEGEVFQPTLVLGNQGEQRKDLTFSDTCKAEMWILNDMGELVYDSRLLKTCNELSVDVSLDSGEEAVFSLPDFTFTDMVGCGLNSGYYTVVLDVPQFHLAQTKEIFYERHNPTDCAKQVSLDITPTISGNDEAIDVSLDIASTAGTVDLQWLGACGVTAKLIDTNGEDVHLQRVLCDNRNGLHLTFNPDEALTVDIGEISMVNFQQQALEEGTYSIQLTLEANPPILSRFSFEWPIVEQEVVVEDSQVVETEEEQPRILIGQWNAILGDEGTCWILESAEEGQVLLSRAPGGWMPSQSWTGSYQVVSDGASPACAKYSAPSIRILSVQSESAPYVEPAPVEEEEIILVEEVQEEVIEWAPSAITVVTTTSVLSLLVMFVTSNESVRIPATAGGLWFFGLMGRTHETSDGRFQRGRLMGYLTANPGCHFRALMSALDMSNGQITHHLRILEAEERIWRRKDGRLVRFYPLTAQLQPHMEEEALPVPPLSPDPNSLQGKILSLLDNDGQMGEFPTQAELAKRLEKSQQLISHHLRTLQKFGLVEKRKMGVRNRYKLTREAIFLLETSEDFTQQ